MSSTAREENNPSEVEKVIAERSKTRGDHMAGFRVLGRAWAAILSAHFKTSIEDIPPHIVGLMHAQQKLIRAIISVETVGVEEDSFLDLEAYLKLSKDCIEREKNGQ